MVGGPADPQPPLVVADRAVRRKTLPRLFQRQRIAAVGSGDGGEEVRHVGHRAPHRTVDVEWVPQAPDRGRGADPPGATGAGPTYIVESWRGCARIRRGRLPVGPAPAMPVASATAAPPDDPAGRATRVPRIAGDAEHRVERCAEPGAPFRRIGLAQQDRAGRLFSPPDQQRVFGRHVVGEDRRSVGRADPRGVDQILDRKRQAPERRKARRRPGMPRRPPGRRPAPAPPPGCRSRLTIGLTRSIRRRNASVTSTADTSRRASRAARSVAGRKQRSSASEGDGTAGSATVMAARVILMRLNRDAGAADPPRPDH